MTTEQGKTLEYVASVAKETGETMETWPSDDGVHVFVSLTAGAAWDYEVQIWRLEGNGLLVLL